MAKNKIRMAVLVSGSSTNLQALIKYGFDISLVVADRGEDRGCLGEKIARKAGIPFVLVPRSFKKGEFDNDARIAFTQRVLDVLQEHHIEFVVMAGFMTILSPLIFEHNQEWIVNFHPALLPSGPKGAHGPRDALAMGLKETGSTLHVATEDVDTGRILNQVKVDILPEDTEESLKEKIKVEERAHHPAAIEKYIEEIFGPQQAA